MPLKAPDGLPEINASTREVITLLLRGGPMPRAELARRLSLTPASLTKLTKPLVQRGLFVQIERPTAGSLGRPVQPLSVNPEWAAFVGVKLTEDRAYAVLTDLAGVVLKAHDVPVQGRTVGQVCHTIVALVNVLRRRRTPVGLGVSLAGPVVRSQGRVVSSPFLGWVDVDLASALEPLVRMPVVIENDLRALTIAQHWSDVTLTSFALVTFGAGIGCGLVLDDRLIAGSHGAGGLIDHLRVDCHGPQCSRGHRGCVSGYATTAAILQAAVPDSQKTVAKLPEVAAMARAGDPHAAQVLGAAGYAMGVAIGTVCNVAGPDRVFLSGEGAELFDTLETPLRQGMSDVIHPILPSIPLTVLRLTFADWARGAAVVAVQHHLALRSGHVLKEPAVPK
jgi:predicted NBD/HSP70 family sugar kinase